MIVLCTRKTKKVQGVVPIMITTKQTVDAWGAQQGAATYGIAVRSQAHESTAQQALVRMTQFTKHRLLSSVDMPPCLTKVQQGYESCLGSWTLILPQGCNPCLSAAPGGSSAYRREHVSPSQPLLMHTKAFRCILEIFLGIFFPEEKRRQVKTVHGFEYCL